MAVVQPQYAAPIDWSNPITRGLAGAGYGHEARNLVDNTRSTNNTAGRGVYRGGLGRVYQSSSQTARDIYHQITNNPQKVTVAALCIQFSASSAVYGIVGSQEDSLASSGFGLKPSSGNLWRFILFDAGGQKNAVGANVELNKVQFAVGKTDGSTASVWVDGRQQGSIAHSGISYSGTNRLLVGQSINSGFDGAVLLWLYWERALSDAEVRALSANPWQVLKAPSRERWIEVGGGGGPTAISFSSVAYYLATQSVQNTVSASLSAAAVVGSALAFQSEVGITHSTASAAMGASGVSVASEVALSQSPVVAAATDVSYLMNGVSLDPATLTTVASYVSFGGMFVATSSALVDLVVQKLGYLGYTGDITAMLVAFYKDNGATSSDIVDAEWQWLDAQGFHQSQVTDKWQALFEARGYVAAFNDNLTKFWKDL